MSSSVVIGSSVTDLYHALETNAYMLINQEPPLFFEGAQGQKSEEIWNNLYWHLLFKGRVFPGQISSMEIDTTGSQVKVRTPSGDSKLVPYDQCLVSSAVNLSTKDPLALEVKFLHNRIIDYYEANSHSRHELDCLYIGQDFVHELIFYVTPRIDGNKKNKDFVVISRLSDDQKMDFEYSDTMVTFAVKDILSEKFNINASHLRIKHQTRSSTPVYDFHFFSAQNSCVKMEPRQVLNKDQYANYKSKYIG